MSHGATSTTHNMTFNNVHQEMAAAANTANSTLQPRSFNNVTNADGKSMSSTSNPPFGGRSNLWGSSSIWGGGITNGLTSTTAARENTVSRDLMSTPLATPTEEIEGKTGSGSLVDSSVSEDYVNRSTWGAKRSAGPGRSMSNARYNDSAMPQQQQRSTSNAGISQTFSGANQNMMPFASRPQTINLTSTTTVQSRQSFGSGFVSGFTGRTSEQPPNVYTKFDRPIPPADHMQKKPDSAIGSWLESATTPSPSDERRPQFPITFNRAASMPQSRDPSLPPSRHGDDAPIFTRPDYSRPSQRATPTSSRAPSLSSSRNGTFSNYLNGGSDQMISHMGQLNLNGDSRPSTSYKSSSTTNGYSNGSNFTAPRQTLQSLDTGRPDDIENIDRFSMNYLGLDDYAPNQANTFANGSTPSFAERYLRSGGSYEFQPGQPYLGGAANSRSFDRTVQSRTSSEWQSFANGTLSNNRRSPGGQELQAYFDPRAHQYLAAQIRHPFAAAMYNPYAMPNAVQLNQVSPYLMLPPLNITGLDSPCAARDSPVGDGVQSALMYEFKSNTKTKRYDLRDIYDHIAEFSGDQHGSRFIQTKLETANSDEKERVFREIQPNAIPLMTDVFGNYVIQKFFEHGDQTHKKILANKMKGQVLTLSLQMYGCRVVQKALDHVLVDQQASLISELEGHVLKCVKDQNGNHVIQKAIERCPSSNIGFIISAFQGQVQHLSIHPYGCRVIQRCLEKCDLPLKSMIMSELMHGIDTMISDQFGNYVVQHIVAHDNGEPKQRVLAIVGRGLEGYSKHKFASNVVEKCLERSDDAWRRQVVLELAHANQMRTEGEGVLVGMIRDNFGNYVIQKLLDTLCLNDYLFFLDLLHPAMQACKRTGCGKQVQSIDKKMHRFDSYCHGGPSGMPMSNRNAFLSVPAQTYGSSYTSATNTQPSLVAESSPNSGLPSITGDTVEGAAASRKGSQQSSNDPGLHQ